MTRWLASRRCCARRASSPTDFERDVAAEADRWGADVRSACLSARSKEPIEIFDHVYDEPHVGLDAQRAQFAAYLDGFADAAAGGESR